MLRTLIKSFALVLSLSLVLPKTSLATEFEIAAGEWPPFYSQTMRDQGIGTRLTRAVFARMGYQVTHRFYPFKRVLARVSAAAVLAADCIWDTPERRELAYLADEPLMTHDLVVLRRRDAGWSFETMNDLSSKRVAIILGYDYGARLMRNPGIYWSLSPDLPSSIRQVKAGRVDFLVEAREVLEYALATEFHKEQDALMIDDRAVFDRRACHVAFNRTLTGRAMAEAFSETLRAMKSDGSYEELLATATRDVMSEQAYVTARD